MPELTITVRDTDMEFLTVLTARDWRTLELQASAMLEKALGAERAKANAPEKPATTRRGPRATA